MVGAGFVLAGTLAGGGAVAVAASGDDERLVGENADRAAAAAIEHVGGGEAIGVELDSEGARMYEVEVKAADGRVVEVDLDEKFAVLRTEEDSDAGGDKDESEGPEEQDAD